MADVNIINGRVQGQGKYLLLYLDAAGVFYITNSVWPVGVMPVPVSLRITGLGTELTISVDAAGVYTSTINPIQDGSDCVRFLGATSGLAASITISYPSEIVTAGGYSDTLSEIFARAGGGGGADEPIGVIDFENNTYSWGVISKSRSDLAGNSGPWVFNPTNLTANGYEGEAFFAIVGEALTAMIAGSVVVIDCTVGANTVQLELYDAPGFNTDAQFGRGSAYSYAQDGNGGGSGNTATGSSGRGKASFLVTDEIQQACDQGGEPVTCSPVVVRSVEPNTVGVSANTGTIIHSIKFYETDADLVALSEVGGGGGNWWPDDAKIYIDFVNDRAWTEADGEVEIDTLVGADANTENGWGTTEYYGSANITADGYTQSPNPPAFIGAARSAILDEATVVFRIKNVGGGQYFVLVSEDGNDAVEVDVRTDTTHVMASSWNGPLNLDITDIANIGGGVTNTVALTITPSRCDIAANGSDALIGALDASDRPSSNPLIAVTLDIGDSGGAAIQSVTIYDALPSTAGLSALSETGVTNTAPHSMTWAWTGGFTEISPTEGSISGGDTGGAAADPIAGIVAFTATDDEGNPITWSTDDVRFSMFDVGGNNMCLNLITPVTEADSPILVTVRATDPGGLYVEQEFTITVTA